MDNEIRWIVYASLISADNDELDEDTKQELIRRRDDKPDDWAYILEPLGERGKKLIELFEYADRIPQHDDISAPKEMVGEVN